MIEDAIIPSKKNKSVGLVRLFKIRLIDIFYTIARKILKKPSTFLSIEGNFEEFHIDNANFEEMKTNSSSLLSVFAAQRVDECLQSLNSSSLGLENSKADELLAYYGPNEIEIEKAPKWFVQLFRAFLTPFNAVLFLVALVSFFSDIWLVSNQEREFKTVFMVTAMILMSSLIRFWQEYRSNIAATKLKRLISTTASVLRKGEGIKEIDMKKLVPGDIVSISAGDMIPADCRIIQSKDLFVSQSMLTGEAMPVEKKENPVQSTAYSAIIDLENICFMGTAVQSGSAKAVVIHTGKSTYFGSISKAITSKKVETNFDKGVNTVSWLLIRFVLIMVPLVFLINGITKHNWIDAFLFALTIAVGLTPEMLPMIVTTNLAKGAVMLGKKKVIIKKLNAIQNLGAMDVLCTDKTGTLTMDKIVLQLHRNVLGEHDLEVLKWAYLNSFYQTGLKNLLDHAILDHGDVHELLKVEERYTKVDEIPFDFQRRRMSVVLEMEKGKHLLICKGAVEEMLAVCTHAYDPGTDKQLHIDNDKTMLLTEDNRNKILDLCREYNAEGMRVLLIAVKEFELGELTYNIDDEKGLIIAGFIGFLDPPKETANASIKAMKQLGVDIKVLTGDNEIVTKKVCSEVGIEVNEILLGIDIDQLSDDELQRKVSQTNIFAKLSPLQKSRIIQLIKKEGHTVGFLGDGINDAIALKDADVGISVDSAVDIAKESADIILLERDLTVLNDGIQYGRRTFGNIMKYIKMASSSNFGNMVSVLGASAFLPFLPMLPVQILAQNFLYDISQISIPWDQMDEEFIERPQKWNAGGIRKFMLMIGPISSIFDYITFAVLFFYFKANSPVLQSLFQSGWFVEGLLSQTLVVHMIRTRKIPFFQSWATKPVLVLTFMVMAVGIYIPFSPFASSLKLQPLPLNYFPFLILILLGYCFLTQLIKSWFIKKFNYWL